MVLALLTPRLLLSLALLARDQGEVRSHGFDSIGLRLTLFAGPKLTLFAVPCGTVGWLASLAGFLI